MNQYEIHGEVAATGEAIAAVIDAADRFADGSCLSRRDRDRLRLVMEEVVSNVINHGRAARDSSIVFALEACADAVRVSIVDHGAPFDPRRRGPADREPKRSREGGWGWPIILAWCSVEDYRREQDRNHLKLLMRTEAPGKRAPSGLASRR